MDHESKLMLVVLTRSAGAQNINWPRINMYEPLRFPLDTQLTQQFHGGVDITKLNGTFRSLLVRSASKAATGMGKSAAFWRQR